ncbi:hypothetical protein GWK47_040902 [Chionoecetes opilio]|uniref:Uncharacterized protein n=1 Tax=Chionoecetes opilio TaxID=41210 RepID=A0A8J4YJE7_CHIOP|nr:hypothetical protein GWK47_040902 [Chionoecetes opilio]
MDLPDVELLARTSPLSSTTLPTTSSECYRMRQELMNLSSRDWLIPSQSPGVVTMSSRPQGDDNWRLCPDLTADIGAAPSQTREVFDQAAWSQLTIESQAGQAPSAEPR